MKVSEYKQVMNFGYEQYVRYLKEKYGPVPKKYGSKFNKRSDDGLFIHHVREDEVASLSDYKVRKANNPAYQMPENLVYCNYVEHLFLHILIGEETAAVKNLGLHGPFIFIIPSVKGYYENGYVNSKINSGYYKAIDGCQEVFYSLLDRYNELVKKIDIVLDENRTLYLEAEKHLDEDGKALVVLGTGLGKTSTALQYIWKHGCRALVIGPNTLIKDSWNKYGKWVKTTTYSAFANSYRDIDYSEYGLVILDEAHHAGYDEETDRGAKQWSKGIRYLIDNKIIKVLGLTATPERSDAISVSEKLFAGCVCEGRSVEDAIEDGTIHPFSYITSYYDTDGIREEYSTYENKKLVGQLDLAINNTPTVKQIFEKYMPNNKRKGIIFIQDIADKDRAMSIFRNAFPGAEIRAIDSGMEDSIVSENRKWFEETDEGYLMAINMISEGAHYKGVNTLIMFRRTNSYLVFTQQLGRVITLTRDEDPKAIVFDLVNNIENVLYNDRKIEKEKKVRRVGEIIRRLRESEATKSGQIIVADETRNIVECIRALKEDASDAWKTWEDDIIKKYYPEEGPDCYVRLGGKRTRKAVQSRASLLQIKYIGDGWTDEEIEILKRWYSIEGPSYVLKELNKSGYNRNLQSIMGFASKMGICFRNKWTCDEIDTLTAYMSTKTGRKIDYGYLSTVIPNHNRTQIINEIGRLGLAQKRKRFDWTENALNLLKELYPKFGSKCAKQIGCSRSQALQIASKLGIKYEKASPCDLTELLVDSNTMSVNELISKYNMSGSQIRSRVKSNFKHVVSHWTQAEDDIIIEKYSTNIDECCRVLSNRSRGAIVARAKQLGIKCEKCRYVVCIENGKKFSLQDAATFVGKSKGAIVYAIKNNGTSGGYHWKYVEDEEEN